MSVSLSAGDVSLLGRIGDAMLAEPLGSDWLVARNDIVQDLFRLLSMDFIGTTRWNPESSSYGMAQCFGRVPAMAHAFVDEFQFCDVISPRLRSRREPTPILSVIGRAELERTRYYNEFLKPYGTTDGIDLHLYAKDACVGDFRFWREPGRCRVGSREVTLLKLLQPTLLRVTRELYERDSQNTNEWASELTARELQVATLLRRGETDEAIARSLGISYWTVRTHVGNMFDKLAVKNRTALMAKLSRER